MKRIIGLLTAVLMVFPFACGSVSAAEVDYDALLDTYLLKQGRYAQAAKAEVGTILTRCTGKEVKPDSTVESLIENSGEKCALVMEEGAPIGLATFYRKESGEWYCHRYEQRSIRTEQYLERFGENMVLISYTDPPVIFDADIPDAVYYDMSYGSDELVLVESELCFSDYILCLSCEASKKKYVNDIDGVYDLEDLAYAKKFWSGDDINYRILFGTRLSSAQVYSVAAIVIIGIVGIFLLVKHRKRRKQ